MEGVNKKNVSFDLIDAYLIYIISCLYPSSYHILSISYHNRQTSY